MAYGGRVGARCLPLTGEAGGLGWKPRPATGEAGATPPGAAFVQYPPSPPLSPPHTPHTAHTLHSNAAGPDTVPRGSTDWGGSGIVALGVRVMKDRPSCEHKSHGRPAVRYGGPRRMPGPGAGWAA